MPKAILKGSKPGLEPVEYIEQSNNTVHVMGERWSFTMKKDEFEKAYNIVKDEEKPKE